MKITSASARLVVAWLAALRLAHASDMRLVLCLFSFEAFAPARLDGWIYIRNLEAVLRNAKQRAALMQKIIRPLAEFISQHPNGERVFAYDLINEPEWALRGTNPCGDPGYTPLEEVTPVSHEFMERFLLELAQTLRAAAHGGHTPLLTIGQVSPEWRHAWRNLPLDFNQWHLYTWMQTKTEYYARSPVALGFCERPVVIGEMPIGGLHAEQSFEAAIRDLRAKGYAGAWAWSYHQGRVPKGARLRAMLPAARALRQSD